jgi:hypothetical protein
MRRAIREHSRDVAAIVALVLAGLFASFVILANQRASIPGWVPLLGSDRFELEAEFSSAQSITPGQGQSVDIAGVRVGDITGVELEDGHAVVTMEVENDKAHLINSDASMLLRPKTGLNDMVLEVDPGISDEDIEEGSTVPLASTLPNVNPDEILAGLDADTQDFLKLLRRAAPRRSTPNSGGEKLSGHCDAWSRSRATSLGSTPGSRCGARASGGRSTASRCSARSWPPGPGRHLLRRLLERGARLLRPRGVLDPRGASRAARDPARDRGCPDQRRSAGAERDPASGS